MAARSGFVTPGRFLLVANVTGAALGAVQAILVARYLGAGAFGVIGVLFSVNAVVANLLDVRLADLGARLYTEEQAREASGHARSILQVLVVGSAALGAGMAVLGAAAAAVVAPVVVDRDVAVSWAVAAGLVGGGAFLSNAIFFLHRLTGHLVHSGLWRMLAQAATLTIVVSSVAARPGIGTYYWALATATAVTIATGLVSAVVVLHRRDALTLSDFRGWRSALPRYRAGLRFLVLGNLVGYSKLVHRGADVLVLGAVAGDAATGVYRLARSLSDSVYLLYDALNQVRFPAFLADLAAGRIGAFRRTAWADLRRAAALTAVIVVGAAVGAPLMTRYAVEGFRGVAPALVLLVLPFFFVAGVHLWLWPALVHLDDVGRFAALSLAAGGVQVAVVVGGAATLGGTAAGGAAGYLAYYVVLYPLSVARLRRTSPDLVPLPATLGTSP